MKKYVILFYAVLFLMISGGLQSQTIGDEELRELMQKSATEIEESMMRGKSLCDYLENGRFVSRDGNIYMQFFSNENAGYLLFGESDDLGEMQTALFLISFSKIFEEGSAKRYRGGLIPVDNNLNISGMPTLSDFIVYSPTKFGWIFKNQNPDNNKYSEIIFVRHEN